MLIKVYIYLFNLKSFYIRYIYGGRLSLEEYDASDIIKILVAANELGLQELFPYLESFLIRNKANWMEQNFDLIYRTSFENNSFLQLQKYCTDLISKEPRKIFNSPNFSLISEKLLVSLIQNENTQGEIQVWEHVIKWGIAQNPGFPSDIESYSKDDFNTLKNTLQQCIPLIKFHNLSSKEFSEKVYPYRKVLPKELRNDLIQDFLSNMNINNDRPIKSIEKTESYVTKAINVNEIISKKIDSEIITFQHAELISKWIDSLEITDMVKNLYEFKLLYRHSHNSMDNMYEKFHEICDNKSRTVTVI